MDLKALFKNFTFTPMNIVKLSALLLGAVIILAIVFRVLSPVVDTVTSGGARGFGVVTQDALMARDATFHGADGAGEVYEESLAYSKGVASSISIPSPEPPRGGTVGGDAEEFEVTEYSISIEARNKEAACTEIADLKAREYVVFESANEHDRGCNYTFKVEHEKAEEILTILRGYNPKDLSENTYTIKRQLDDFASEEEILERKLASIDETLEGALSAYEEIAVLATRTQNAEALAKIIDSKVGIIERLTQERISITAQLERLARAKAQQLDRLEYTYFHVNVYENKFVDAENLKDSWKATIKGAVRDINRAIQDVTVNLVALLFVLLQYILYLLILLVVAKYLWKAAVYIWKR